MKFRFLYLVLFALLPVFSPIRAESESCIDAFHSFSPIEPEVHPTLRNEIYGHVIAWYTDSRCLVVGSTTGLWLYDIDQPDHPLMLAQFDEGVINHVAVNPS